MVVKYKLAQVKARVHGPEGSISDAQQDLGTPEAGPNQQRQWDHSEDIAQWKGLQAKEQYVQYLLKVYSTIIIYLYHIFLYLYLVP